MNAPREYRFRLEHILENIQAISTAVAGKSEADYRADWMLHSAIERGIESYPRPAVTCRLRSRP